MDRKKRRYVIGQIDRKTDREVAKIIWRGDKKQKLKRNLNSGIKKIILTKK
jgi:hypothetical protein